MKKAARKTPVRQLLRTESTLLGNVQDGLSAVEGAHRSCFDSAIRPAFADSLDIDEGFRAGREQENRWDYLLGHGPSRTVVGVEPHSAKDDQISAVIRKRTAALKQLRDHLRDGARIGKWLWVASGEVRFANTEKARVQLDQNGIEFVGKTVLSKHLPGSKSETSGRSKTSRRRRSTP